MKLSPEAKQAIKTTIEQLRLLLVDDAMDTVREEVGRRLMNDEKSDCSCQIAHTGNCESNRRVVLEAPELEVSCSNPFEEIQTEIKQLKAQVALLAMQTSCNLQTSVTESATISNQAEKRPNEEAPEVERIVSEIRNHAACSEILRQLS